MACRIELVADSTPLRKGVLRISAALPLIASLSIAENIALPRRLCGPAFQRGAEAAARCMLLRLGRAELLGDVPVQRLSAPDTLRVKCLAALLCPSARFDIQCGEHVPQAPQECALLGELFEVYAERLGQVRLYAEPATLQFYKPLLAEQT